MAVKKPKAKKSGFDIGDILKFVESQVVGQKSKDLFQEAVDIPMPPLTGPAANTGRNVYGISPLTAAVAGKIGKGTEALANTGLGQWFGADAAFNLGKPKQSSTDSAANLAALLFSVAPLAGGGVVKKSGKTLKNHLKNGLVSSGTTKDILSVIKMLMGMQGK